MALENTDPAEPEVEQMYTTAYVAELLQVTDETVRDWIASKQLGAIKVNGYWRVPKSKLRAYLSSKYGGKT